MASIEQTATAIASIIDDLANGTITESAAAVLLVDALTGYFPVSQIQDLTDKIIAMIGRMDGTIILSRPPLADEGTIGSVAIDIANKQLYGPKTSSTVDPWGSPQPLIGAQGPAGTITSATVTTGAAGSQAAIVLGGTPSARTFAFTIPRGDKGNTGLTPSLTIGTVTTGAPGSAAAANFTGTTDNPILSLTIPRGDVGPVGATPNVSVAIVMVANGEPATVTRSGTNEAPLLTFSLPSPLDGADGREVEFNVSATHIQTRYVGDTAWVDLIALADLKGPKGDRGKAFDPDATGNTLADRDAYDNEADGFTFLNTATGLVYYRQGAAGNWSDGVAIGAAQSDILDALAALDASTGVLVQTGDATFAKLSIGASSDTNILDRISADGRYRRSSQAIPLAEVTGLVAALSDKADAAAVIAALGDKADKATTYTKTATDALLSDKADKATTYTKTAVDDLLNGKASLVDGKVPASQLPSLSGAEIGDILITVRAPGSKYLRANGASYSRSAYPALSPMMPDGGLTPVTAWTSRTTASGQSWAYLAYGNGLFVAFPSGGQTYMTSPDGITWTARGMPVSYNWGDLIFANGLFVLIVYGASFCYTSPDGITFTQRAMPVAGNSQYTSVAYGNGLFVAVVANSGTYSTSPDGITWTTRTASFTALKVFFGGGLFLVTEQNRILYSTDGITWTARSVNNGQWRLFAYGKGRYVVMSNGNEVSYYLTSTDGINWTAQSRTGGQVAVAFGYNQFVYVDANSNSYTSTDGLNWTYVNPVDTVGAMVAAQAKFVAVGNYRPPQTSNLVADTTKFSVPNLNYEVPLAAYVKAEN